MKDKGLRVKLAVDDNGQAGGMIQYLPIEHSTADGQGLYFINCIWVHGYKQGRGNFQKAGMGEALLKAAEEDVRSLGAKWNRCLGCNSAFLDEGLHGSKSTAIKKPTGTASACWSGNLSTMKWRRPSGSSKRPSRKSGRAWLRSLHLSTAGARPRILYMKELNGLPLSSETR